MFDFAAICRGRTSFGGHRLLSKTHFEWYLSWPELLLKVIAFLRCLILTLFVVAGHTCGGSSFSLMLDFDGICGVPEHLVILLYAFDAWF